MVGKEFLKTAINIFINSVLLILYVSFFGLQSIQKYLDYGVTIVNQEEKPATILPPGMCQSKLLSIEFSYSMLLLQLLLSFL